MKTTRPDISQAVNAEFDGKPSPEGQTAMPPGIPWFIFTSHGCGFCVTAETITRAVADWKRARHKDTGEIVGVIRGAQENAVIGRIQPTPCFGVIVCVQDSQAKGTRT